MVLTGSHIDTVPRGGPLDGALGVLAGLECLRTVAASGARPARALEVAAFTDEEGRFYGFFGSRAMTGSLDPGLAERLTDPTGLALPEAMRRAGFDLARAPEARRDPGEIAAYVELHIEQGPWLEAEDVPIGVVEGIVGIRRFRLTFVGQPDHAGTTPMDRRKDAFLTAAEYATKSRELVVRDGLGRAVTTIGVVDVRPGVPNIVPERASAAAGAARPGPGRPRAPGEPHPPDGPAGGAPARARPRGGAPHARRARPDVPADPGGDRGRRPRSLGLPTRRMPSGAGHDAQVLAAVTDAGHALRPEPGRPEPPARRVDRLAGDRARGQRALGHPRCRLACSRVAACG